MSIARAYGADKTYLVDVGDYCERDVPACEGMAQELVDMGMEIRPEGGFRDVEHMLEHCNAVYLRNGLHEVDLADHLGAALNNLRFSRRV